MRTLSMAAASLIAFSIHPNVEAETTNLGGADYTALCAARGVPLPPMWGSGQWQARGVVPKEKLFIVNAKHAHVYYYESDSPTTPGVCYALPRTLGTTIEPNSFGVICQGAQTGKVCFWDNRKEVALFPATALPIAETAPLVDPPWEGGADLAKEINGAPFDPGGMCTDCHAGRNAFAIHPRMPLNAGDNYLEELSIESRLTAGLNPNKRTPAVWPDPIVAERWFQNPQPIANHFPPTQGGQCDACHTEGGALGAGRLPQISKNTPLFCRSVLNRALSVVDIVDVDGTPTQFMKTMPFFGVVPVGSFDEHINAVKSFCQQAPPTSDPPVIHSMIPGSRDSLHPAIISAITH